MQVKLVEVQGDQEEFADLIGDIGKLSLDKPEPSFLPDDKGDILNLMVKKVVKEDDKITVLTKLGNTFVFVLLAQRQSKSL